MRKSVIKLASWVVVAILLTMDASHGLRILGLFPLPGRSHFIMCESLMRNLASRGHQVDVYSHFPLEEPVPNYTDYSLVGTTPILSNNVSFEFMGMPSRFFTVREIVKTFGKPICNLMHFPIFQKLLEQPPSDPAYDIVIIELFAANCYIAWGRHLNVPVVSIVTSSLFEWLNDPLGNPLNAALDPSLFLTFASPMNFFERVYNFLVTTSNKWFFEYSVREQDALVKQIFGPDFPSVVDLQKDISLLIVNYHHSFQGVRPFVPAVLPAGGLHIFNNNGTLPQKVQNFLDEGKHGFIYFSFGSMMRIETFPKNILEIFYNTFKNIAPVRVLLKIAKPEKLPPGLPSNVLTQPWFSQNKVLDHKNIKAFVTHGGLMGIQEAIYYKVPMITVPLFGDQFFNSESCVKKNIGKKIDLTSITEETFTKTINEIITNTIYKKSVEKIGNAFRDSPISPADRASFWIEYVARHGKDALRSPSVDMYWWQIYLLDVYGFIALVAFLLLFCTSIILKYIIKRVFGGRRCGHSFSKSKLN